MLGKPRRATITLTCLTSLAICLASSGLTGCGGSPTEPSQNPRNMCIARAAFGEPADSAYILPFPVGASYPLLQTYCGPQNHGTDNQLAYDFTIPFGDPVIAARGGVVRHVTEHFADEVTELYR